VRTGGAGLPGRPAGRLTSVQLPFLARSHVTRTSRRAPSGMLDGTAALAEAREQLYALKRAEARQFFAELEQEEVRGGRRHPGTSLAAHSSLSTGTLAAPVRKLTD
jgi:hypothetical protein